MGAIGGETRAAAAPEFSEVERLQRRIFKERERLPLQPISEISEVSGLCNIFYA